VPVLLTPHSTEAEAYELLGECYVYGSMNREIMENLKNGTRKAQEFRLL
jgi:hypothetical protein